MSSCFSFFRSYVNFQPLCKSLFFGMHSRGSFDPDAFVAAMFS